MPDVSIQCALYERAIAEADKRRFAGEANAEEALRSFWLGYVDYIVSSSGCPRQAFILTNFTLSATEGY